MRVPEALARLLVLLSILLPLSLSASWAPRWPRPAVPLVRCGAAAAGSSKPGTSGKPPASHPHLAPGTRGKQLLSKIRNETMHLIDMAEDAIEDEVAAIGRFVKREKIAIEHLEHRLEEAWKNSRMARTLCIKGAAGSALMLSGAHFSRCVVLAHTLRVTGWPVLQRAVKEIAHAYKEARQVVQREVGHLVRPGEILQAVRFEIRAVQRLVKESQQAAEDGKITKAEEEEIVRQAQLDMKRLNREAWVLNQAVDSISAITAAIDFHKMRDVSKSIYTGALAVFASANSITVRNLSLAFDLGALIGNNINCLAQSLIDHYHAREIAEVLPPETRRLISLTIGCVGALKGLVIVQAVVPKMSLRISSAALGAAWVTEAFADIVDPHLERLGWGRIDDRAPFVPIHLCLTILGYRFQKRYAGNRFPRLIEQMLTPLSIMEQQLKKYDKVFKGK